MRKYLLIRRSGISLRFEDLVLGTQRFLGFGDRAERPRGQERKDRRSEACDIGRGDKDGLVEDVRIDLIQNAVALRDSSAVDDPENRRPVLLHVFENDTGVKRASLDGG